MRQAVLLFAATAAALVTPDEVRTQQISILDNSKSEAQNAVQSWWDALPDVGGLFSGIETQITKHLQLATLDSIFALTRDDKDEDDNDEADDDEGRHRPHGPHGDPDKTIYELIKESKRTTKFAKLVDEHEEIKQLLQDTEHNHTLFVPTDRAFEHLPCHRHDKHGDCESPSEVFVHALLKYHAVPGLYPLRRVRAHHTLPSELLPAALGNDDDDDDETPYSASTTSSSSYSSSDDEKTTTTAHPQRIRVSTTLLLRRIRLNLHARVVAGDFRAKNGLVHALDAVLLPPPRMTTILRLLPAHFSTFALALETTGVRARLDDDERERRAGGTVFAPTNGAFARLGPRVNAFLFSERGRKYLEALVKYHVVVNQTLYSDAFYRGKGRNGDGDGDGDEEGADRSGRYYWHVDLPSLLDDKPLSVDVREWRGFVSIVVNGFVRVAVRDGVADDGVIQAVEHVLIPPHRHRGRHGPGEGGDESEDISVEELKRRLEPYLENSVGQKIMGDL
ncbi:hypothetical protein VTK56DRAFT_2635 [Thermocarpiscus australiensis]